MYIIKHILCENAFFNISFKRKYMQMPWVSSDMTWFRDVVIVKARRIKKN